MKRLPFCAGLAVSLGLGLAGCARSPGPPVPVAEAPPGPEDLGPAIGLAETPKDAVVFDLRYRPQRGQSSDVIAYAFWGFGGRDEESKTNSFIQEVRKQTVGTVQPVFNGNLPGRQWAAVEYERQRAQALYFDLNADGKLDPNERIPPTRSEGSETDFVTPDFMHTPQNGAPMLTRVLLQANFYDQMREPNCYWSPAAVLEGKAQLDGKEQTLLLFANGPGGGFDQFGGSSYSLLEKVETGSRNYIPRETLSSLIPWGDTFYHLTVDGRRSNGLPARVMLVKDTTPTGSLAVKLATTNALKTQVDSLYIQGVEDKTVHLGVQSGKTTATLPEGSYTISYGAISYGLPEKTAWQVNFREAPAINIKAGQVAELNLGQPSLKVRAVDEQERYAANPKESSSFKQGTRIYLEPKIVGTAGEAFTRFQEGPYKSGENNARPPRVTITGPDGKELLAQTMEYG